MDLMLSARLGSAGFSARFPGGRPFGLPVGCVRVSGGLVVWPTLSTGEVTRQSRVPRGEAPQHRHAGFGPEIYQL